MEQAGMAYLIHDEPGRILDANPTACEALGYTREELLAMRIPDIDPVARQPERHDLRDRVQAGEQFIFETRYVRKDGVSIPVEITLGPLNLADGQAFLSIVRDLTRRKQQEEMDKGLIDAMHDTAFVIGFDGKFLDVNERAVEALGYTRDEMLTMGPRDIDPFLSSDEIQELIVGMESDEQQRFLTQHRTKNGAVIPVEIISSQVWYQGNPAILSIARDISERRRAEVMTEARLRLLELAAQTTLEGFLQATLDELETLTCSLVGFCNFLEADENTLTPQAWSTRTLRDFCEAGSGRKLSVDEAGVWADCVREQRPVIHNDYASLQHRKGMPPGHAELVRELVVPVFRGDKIVAVFAVGNKPKGYDEHDVELVSNLADLAWDIAARKLVETWLVESEARSRRLLDASPDAVFVLDVDGRFVDCNHTAVERYGFSRQELLQMTARDLAPPDLHDEATDWLSRALETGATFEWRHRRKDGSEMPVEIRAVPISAGEELGILSTVRDISERKQAEAALHDSEERFRGLSSMSTEGIMIHHDGIIIDANQAFARLMGFEDADELVGRRGLETLPVTPESRQRIEVHMRDRSSETYEVEITRADGSTVWAETSGKEIAYRGSSARLVSMRDVTERKLAEAELRKSEEQLRQSQRMESVGRLAGGIAHDFNNMLGVILGHAELAMQQLDRHQPVFADLREIRDAANRSAAIAQQLLAFARRQTASPLLLDLNVSVQRMLEMLRRLVGEDIELVWVPGIHLGTVVLDPSQLDQILVNLCANARDAIAGAGRITIETAAVTLDESFCAKHAGCVPGEYVLLSVSDDGNGMDADILDHLFEPFFTTKETGKGTGLGLATVYGIVKQNGGYIEVRSEPGQGSSFSIYLPQHAEPAMEEQRKPTVATARGKGETLLVVEDEPSVLRLAEKVLLRLDYKVLSAETPAEALRIAEAHPGEIHLLVTDVIMPEMSGWNLAEKLLSARPGLRTLYVSGYASEIVSGRGLLKEGVGFLQKPFSPDDLAANVRAALDQE